MRRNAGRWGIYLFLLALAGEPLHAQTIAASFQELQTMLKVGEILIVTDRDDRETWGRVVEVSEFELLLLPMERTSGEAAIRTGSANRTFAEANVAEIRRSDMMRTRGILVYPATWDKVNILASGSAITVLRKGGEQRDYLFKDAGGDSLTLTTPSGQDDVIPKSLVARIVRKDALDDPVANGIGYGMAAGLGAALALIGIAYAACGDCEAPSPGPVFLMAGGIGAGAGAAVGWVIDKLHRGDEVLFPLASVSPPLPRSQDARSSATVEIFPIVSNRSKGVSMRLRF